MRECRKCGCPALRKCNYCGFIETQWEEVQKEVKIYEIRNWIETTKKRLEEIK